MSDRRIGVMHLVDTLVFGGAERAAVDYVNHLPRETYCPFLCTTRQSGPLATHILPDVSLLHLNRRRTFELTALWRLIRFIREQKIRLLHAHGSALFVSRLVRLIYPRPALIWHLHYGRWALEDHREVRYLLAATRLDAIVTSSDQLAEWIQRRFFASRKIVMHLPNMIAPVNCDGACPELPGRAGLRIVNVANLRAEKDQLTLVRAFARVLLGFPEAHLLLIGRVIHPGVARELTAEIRALGIASNVSLLGERPDVAKVLAQCDVAVLSSVSEGLPVSLLEYGRAGLPTVATTVGQCSHALNGGSAGLLVAPRNPGMLANALERLLSNETLRGAMGTAFQERVNQLYGARAVTTKLCHLYEQVLAQRVAAG